MTRWRAALSRVRGLFRSAQLDRDLRDEIAGHLEEATEEYVRQGRSPDEARVAALRSFGGVTQAQEAHRDARAFRWLDDAWRDLQYAVRMLRRTPRYTAVAVLTLGLGMGANTAIFSLINGLFLRSMPVADPEHLVTISTGPALAQQQFSNATWNEIRRHSQLFGNALAWGGPGRVNVTSDGDMETFDALFVSGEYFNALGVSAILGRMLTPADDIRGGVGPDGPVSVISYGLWQRRFGGAADIIGRLLTIERVPLRIIGVAPPQFLGLEVGRTFDLAVPISTQPLLRPTAPMTDDNLWLTLMLRLKPAQSIGTAMAALRADQSDIRVGALPQVPQMRPAFLSDPFILTPAAAGVSTLRQRYERPLGTILVVVALVLLVGCANIANLLLARAAARRHELSVRLALGASRWQLARQFLTESIVLAAIGAAVGLVFASWAGRLVVAQLSTGGAPVVLDLTLDGRVLAFTVATMVATLVVFGFGPAFRATRVSPMDVLKAQGRGAGGEARSSLSSGLVVAQVAISLMLVIAAGLFVRTFERLARAALGFDADRVLVVTVDAGRVSVPQAARGAFDQRLVSAAASVPGVAHAGGSFATPMSGPIDASMFVTVPGADPTADGERHAQFNVITPGWLATYGTPMHGGRDIEDRDANGAAPVVLVNDAFVHRFLAARSVIGTTFSLALDASGNVPVGAKTVIGVVGNAVYRSVRAPVPPTIYLPLAQWSFPIQPRLPFFIGVRPRTGVPTMVTRGIIEALNAVDRNVVLAVRPLADQVDASLSQERLIAMLSGFFGALALLLAGLGLYGVTSYAVARRRTEIGIRMALGAAPESVVWLMLSRVSVLVGLGVLVGAGLSLWASTFVASLLYGLEPRDPVTLIGSAVTLATVAALAGSLPAYRASRIDPAEVLRES